MRSCVVFLLAFLASAAGLEPLCDSGDGVPGSWSPVEDTAAEGVTGAVNAVLVEVTLALGTLGSLDVSCQTMSLGEPLEVEACSQVVAGMNYHLRFRVPLVCGGVESNSTATVEAEVYKPLQGDFELTSKLVSFNDNSLLPSPASPGDMCDSEDGGMLGGWSPVDDTAAEDVRSAVNAVYVDVTEGSKGMLGTMGEFCTEIGMGEPLDVEACSQVVAGMKYKLRFEVPLICEGAESTSTATVEAEVYKPLQGDYEVTSKSVNIKFSTVEPATPVLPSEPGPLCGNQTGTGGFNPVEDTESEEVQGALDAVLKILSNNFDQSTGCPTFEDPFDVEACSQTAGSRHTYRLRFKVPVVCGSLSAAATIEADVFHLTLGNVFVVTSMEMTGLDALPGSAASASFPPGSGDSAASRIYPGFSAHAPVLALLLVLVAAFPL